MINFVLFIGFLLICTLVRFFQLDTVDFETGFFKPDAGALQYAVYIAAVIAFAVFLLIGLKGSKTGFFRRANTRVSDIAGKICGAVMMFVAASFAMSGAEGFIPNSASLVYKPDTAGGLLAFLGAAGFAVIAFALFRERRYMPYSGYCVLFIALYYVVSAAVIFKDHLVIKRMSSPLTELFTDILLLFFYFGLGRMLIRSEDRRTRVKTLAFGYTAALLSMSESFAFWLYNLVKPATRAIMENNSVISYPDADFFMQGLAAAALIAVIGVKAPRTRRF